jgi:aspartate-semialdehyde dehydrogenase
MHGAWKRYGLKEVSIVIFQSLTGKGDAKYPHELVVGNVYSLHNSDEKTEENILAEMQKIFREAIPLSVSCNRVFVQEGHLVNVKIKTFDRIKSEQEITELLESFDPLRRLRLPSSPRSPLTVIHDVGRPRPRQDSFHDGGMSVAIGGVSTKDSVYDCKFQYVVNNLVRGAAGGAILNSELYIQKEN